MARTVAGAKKPWGKTAAGPVRLEAEAWEEAALVALETQGIAGVAVEPLSRALGVTKGSFYWHFTDRAALLRAVLARWEERATNSVIAWLATVDAPRERLVQLITRASVSDRTWRIHVALGSALAEPAVALALERVSRRRIGYLEECYAKLGIKPQAARRAALLAYASYLGITRLRLEAPRELPEAASMRAYTRHVVATLVPPARSQRKS
jgi:AcrR family transcriptional regulator